MEYYSTRGGLSLQDMIECDIKTDIDELMKSSNHLHGLDAMETGDAVNNFDIRMGDIDIKSAEVINFSSGENEMTMLPNLEAQTLDWLNNVDVHNLSVGTENTNPNLLVNPQTGMPIQPIQQQQQIRINTTQNQPGVQNISISNSTIHAKITPTQNGHIQFINIPTSAIRQQSFIPVQTLQSTLNQQIQSPFRTLQQHITVKPQLKSIPPKEDEKKFPKPVYSYSCLIAMALKNSKNGNLPVSEIYNFMTMNFPYFKTAPDGWKNSVRHNLSLNKCFEKIENPKSQGGSSRKGCLWAMNPAKIEKMEEEIAKWRKKDPVAIKRAMAKPDDLDKLERGLKGTPSEPKDLEPVTLSIPEGSHHQGVKDIVLSDINLLDNNLVELNDLDLQHTLLEEFYNAEEINIDNVPVSASPMISSGNIQILSSPSIQLTPTKALPLSEENTTSIQGSYVYTPVSYGQFDNNLLNQSHSQYFYSPTSRTVSAQT
ncbi:forkhead box protein N4-like [Lineus longissimus]|uniref:forkhead box protein N4-like n=1 Tax=Lineus longissimus TaxID=88925 RepID=UPI00315C9991